MIFCISIFIFCLEPTVRQELDENDIYHCYGIFFESTILKLLEKIRRMCLDLYHLRNNSSLLFEEHCTKAFHLLLYASFSVK